MNVIMYTFNLDPTIYAASCEESVIILDAKNDKYLSLIGDAAKYLKIITSFSFVLNDGVYSYADENLPADSDNLTSCIVEFKKRGFIIEREAHVVPRGVLPTASKTGGLCGYKWDTKVDWQPFEKASWLSVAKAYLSLRRVHKHMKKNGLHGIFSEFKKPKNFRVATQAEIDHVIAAVDAATKLYGKKSFCLAWAATFTIEALKRGWDCHFKIGVQAIPFYAHAWAELNNRVVHDDAQVAEVLSIIASKPE